MSKLLNVGIMQYEISADFETNMEKVEKNVQRLMNKMNRPEIVFGPEMAFGARVHLSDAVCDRLGEIAARHKIYFLPGSMYEDALADGKPVLYNTLPIFGPEGQLIDRYRKICPYYPAESTLSRGDRHVVFHMKEKDICIGVMICHDWCFPEISRNLALMGAEILFRPAIDPEGLYEGFHHVPSVRALENQAYFISLNACGKTLGGAAYGHSVIASPEGRIIYEAENVEVNLSLTLDLSLVENSRLYGTFYTEQLLRQLKLFELDAPFGDRKNAPLLKELPMPDMTVAERLADVKKIGLNHALGMPAVKEE